MLIDYSLPLGIASNLTGRFLQTLIMKAADIVNTNPAKVALGLAKAIIEAKNVRPYHSS